MHDLLISDRRLKRDITWLAVLPNGINIYAFRYTWSDTAYVGVIAQDLLPDSQWRRAVVQQPDGYLAVNYARLGLQMTTFDVWQANGLGAVLWSPDSLDMRAA